MGIKYWTTPDGRAGLVIGADKVAGADLATATDRADLPEPLRADYDAMMAAPPPPVPQTLTPLQLRMVLLGMGMLDTVDSTIDALPEPDRSAARIAWEHATAFERGHPFISAVAQAAQLTDEQVDALFVAGARL